MNTSSRLPGWTAGWILVVRMASSFIACCILHIISIPFNCSDTALRVTDAKIGPKVKIFVFRYVCFVSQIWCQDLWLFLISETGLKFLIWTQGKIHPGNRASPVNRAHMKRPLVISSPSGSRYTLIQTQSSAGSVRSHNGQNTHDAYDGGKNEISFNSP